MIMLDNDVQQSSNKLNASWIGIFCTKECLEREYSVLEMFHALNMELEGRGGFRALGSAFQKSETQESKKRKCHCVNPCLMEGLYLPLYA